MAVPLSVLLRPLVEAGLELDVEAARDAVWLALRIGERTPASVAVPDDVPDDVLDDVTEELPVESPETVAQAIAPGVEAPVLEATDQPAESTQASALPGGAEDAQAVRLPIAAALPESRSIARCLRPLRRRVASTAAADLDVEATVRRAAEEDVWLPVMRARPERWLDLALVVDDTPSMLVWRDVVHELRRVLHWSGAFRRIDTWWARTDERPGLFRHAGAGDERARRPASLTAVPRRGLVLVITDCVADAWYDGSYATQLAEWSRTAPVAIVQVLPPRLWGRTALGLAAPVHLRAPAVAATNEHLTGAEMHGWTAVDRQDAQHAFVAPVATIDPRSLGQLARLVGGPAPDATAGFFFDIAAMRDLGPPPPPRDMDARERVRRFWSVASSPARRLASAFAASPFLSLRVLRLLRRELIPHGSHIHEAEVLLSGIVQRAPDRADLDHGDVPLAFSGGVRPLLLDNVNTDDALRVLRRAAELAAEDQPDAHQFLAALDDPDSVATALSSNEGTFAHAVAGFMSWIGGPYARIVARSPGQAASTESSAEPAVAQEAPRPMMPSGTPFLDRVSQLEALRSWWRDESAVPVTVIVGPPGSGKSALARAFVDVVRASSNPVVLSMAEPRSPAELLASIATSFALSRLPPDLEETSASNDRRIASFLVDALGSLSGRHLLVLEDVAATAERLPDWLAALPGELSRRNTDFRLLAVTRSDTGLPPDWPRVHVTDRIEEAEVHAMFQDFGIEVDERIVGRVMRLSDGTISGLGRIADAVAALEPDSDRPATAAAVEGLLTRLEGEPHEEPAQSSGEPPEYWIYFSYARQDRDSYLENFVSQLRDSLSVRLGVPHDRIGFFDFESIRPSDDWPPALNEGLQNSRILLAFLSPRYIRSETCGREWDVFLRRQARYGETGEPRAPVILPVLWVPESNLPQPLPAVVQEVQYIHSSYGPEYPRLGVRGMLATRSETQFAFVEALASRIIEIGERYAVPPLPDIDLDLAENAFAGGERTPEYVPDGSIDDLLEQIETADPEHAIDLASDGIRAADEEGRPEDAVTLMVRRAVLLFHSDRREEAQRDFEDVTKRALEIGPGTQRAAALVVVGRAAVDIGDLWHAQQTLGEALSLQQRASDFQNAAATLDALARVALRREEFATAAKRFSEAADMHEQARNQQEAAHARAESARTALASGDSSLLPPGFLEATAEAYRVAGRNVQAIQLTRTRTMAERRRPGEPPPTVVIFGHPSDKEWAERLTRVLRPFEEADAFRVNDLVGPPTAPPTWRPGSSEALDEADAVVILVSWALLQDERGMQVAERVARDRPVRALPLLVERGDWGPYDWLTRLAIRSTGGPLDDQPAAERPLLLADFAIALGGFVSRTGVRRSGHGPEQGSPLVRIHIAESRDPELSQDAELAHLDQAWRNHERPLVVVSGPSGAGKTTLVNGWLERLRQDNYRGAALVFGWSFYTDADARNPDDAVLRFLTSALGWLGIEAEGDPLDLAKQLAKQLRRFPSILILDGVERLSSTAPGGRTSPSSIDRAILAMVPRLLLPASLATFLGLMGARKKRPTLLVVTTTLWSDKIFAGTWKHRVDLPGDAVSLIDLRPNPDGTTMQGELPA